jgi:hypothetical protein
MAIEMKACKGLSRKIYLPMAILALVKGVCVKLDGKGRFAEDGGTVVVVV